MTQAPPTDDQGTTAVPDRFVDLDAERELLAAALRAGEMAEQNPALGGPQLPRIAAIEVDDLVYREHRAILRGIQTVLAETGTITPLLVRDALRAARETDALRLLPEVAVPARPTTVASLSYLVKALRRTAGLRRRFVDSRNDLVDMLTEPA